jgi:O-antigen ligase
MTLKNKYLDITQHIMMGLILLSCVSIWLPIAFMSVFMSLFMIVWLISGNYADKFARIKRNPAAVSATALLALYAVGISYSSTSSHAAFAFGAKYHKLLFIPMIASVLHDDKLRKLALNVFLGASLVILALSYLKWLGVPMPGHHVGAQGNVIFKGRIAHNIFMSFAMYLMIHKALTTSRGMRLIWIILSLFAFLNILFLVNGRTGQITMAVLASWFIVETWGIKKLSYCLMLGLITLTTLQVIHKLPNSRYTNFQQEAEGGVTTSAGARLAMYKSTLILVKRHPLFGGGTGSLEHEYKSLAESQHSTMVKVTNPHNQYLLTTQELGVVGLICLLWMWLTHWRTSYRLSSSDYGFALRGLVITITVGSLFNSLILDASEGQFYCVLVGVLLSAYVRQKPSETT